MRNKRGHKTRRSERCDGFGVCRVGQVHEGACAGHRICKPSSFFRCKSTESPTARALRQSISAGYRFFSLGRHIFGWRKYRKCREFVSFFSLWSNENYWEIARRQGGPHAKASFWLRLTFRCRAGGSESNSRWSTLGTDIDLLRPRLEPIFLCSGFYPSETGRANEGIQRAGCGSCRRSGILEDRKWYLS